MREDALELAVEVHFVAGQLLEPIGVERLAEGLRPDQVAVLQLAAPAPIPGHDLVFQEALQVLRVGLIGLAIVGFAIIVIVVGVVAVFRVGLGKHLRPTGPSVLMQDGQSLAVSIGPASSKDGQRPLGHHLIFRQVLKLGVGALGRRTNSGCRGFGWLAPIQMRQGPDQDTVLVPRALS